MAKDRNPGHFERNDTTGRAGKGPGSKAHSSPAGKTTPAVKKPNAAGRGSGEPPDPKGNWRKGR